MSHPSSPTNPYARADLGGEATTAEGTPAGAPGAAADAATTAPDPQPAGDSPPGGEATSPPAEPATDALAAQVEGLQDQVLRAAAELDNLRKRSRREVEEARRQTKDRLLCDMLPVVDNLERALVHAKQGEDAVAQGVRMVLKQFQDFLGQHQVMAFVSIGTPFDPVRHEAIGQEPSTDLPPHTVLRELQQGYNIEQRLLRAARVVVAMAPPAQP